MKYEIYFEDAKPENFNIIKYEVHMLNIKRDNWVWRATHIRQPLPFW